MLYFHTINFTKNYLVCELVTALYLLSLLEKRWKEVVEIDMLGRELKRTDALDQFLWRYSCKNRLIPACSQNKLGSRTMKISRSSDNCTYSVTKCACMLTRV